MPIYRISGNKLNTLPKKSFNKEKSLQNLVENNLETIFGVRFVATEFSTSKNHAGRIDSLGVDENNSPVIIEYKNHNNDAIINQGLFYLDWLVDHKGDFQVLCQKALGKNIEIDFKTPRLILIAENFSKYDEFAINRMAENIELWKYALYNDEILEFRLVGSSSAKPSTTKKKITKVDYEEFTLKHHTVGKPKNIKELFETLRSWTLGLGEGEIQEVIRKHYISYKTSRAFVYFHLQKSAIKIHIISLDDLTDPKKMTRDVSKIGHYGYGNAEIILKNHEDIDYVFDLIKQAYNTL